MAKDFCSAITFSGSSFEWAKCSFSKGNFSISSSGALGDIPIEPNDVEDESNSTIVAEYQKELAFYSKKVSSKLADKNTISIPTSRVVFMIKSFPSTDLNEIQQMALADFEAHSPAPIEEMVLSFDILEQADGSSRVLLCAVKEEDILSQLQYLDVTPKKVERVDASIMGLFRNLVDTNHLQDDGERSVVLAKEGSSLVILVIDGVQPCAIRHIGNADAISKFTLISGINKTIRQVNGDFSKKSISKLFFVNLGNTNVYLHVEHIKAAINADDNLSTFTLSTTEKYIQGDKNSLPLNAVGVAKRSFDKRVINLYPSSWTYSLQQQKIKIRNLSICGFILLLWVALVCYLYAYPVMIKQEVTKAKKISDQLLPESSEVQDYRKCINIIEQYSDRSQSPLEILREVCVHMPDGIVITQFRYKGTEKVVQIEGRADSSSIVYQFMTELRTSKLFGENSLISGPKFNKNLNKDIFELGITISPAETDASEEGN